MNHSLPFFIAIQNTYTHIELSLWKNTEMIALHSANSKDSSKRFIAILDELLSQHKLALKDLSFLAVNTGPGPFSTLSTLIASVNGIAFACGIPLINVDGLQTLALEHAQQTDTVYMALLNAFNDEVYFAYLENNQMLDKGYKKIDTILSLLSTIKDKQIVCFGNGSLLFKHLLEGQKNIHVKPDITTCSSKAVALNALHQWNMPSQHTTTQLHIGYLKYRAW